MSIGVLALCSGSALAAPWEPPTKAAQKQVEAAAALFQKDDFAGAAQGFEDANRLAANNRAVWNAAQSHAAGGNWPRALELIDQLLADPDLPRTHLPTITTRRKLAASFVAAARAADEGRFDEAQAAYEAIAADATVGPLDRAQASKAIERVTAAREAARAAEKPRPADPPPTADPPEVATQAPVPPPPPPKVTRGRDWLGWSLVAGGVAVAAGGGAVWWTASGLYDDADGNPDQGAARDLYDRGDTRRVIGQVAVGVGVVALGAGIAKLALGGGDRAPAVALTPTADGGAVVFLGDF